MRIAYLSEIFPVTQHSTFIPPLNILHPEQKLSIWNWFNSTTLFRKQQYTFPISLA